MVSTAILISLPPQEEIEDDEFFTARNTMVQRFSAQARGGAGDKRAGVEPSGDGTITGDLDLGTLVIIDDEEEMDTMKSKLAMSSQLFCVSVLWRP